MAMTGSGMRCAASTPMKAEIVLPPMTDQGWASGLAGTAKISTAEAPIGATINGMCGPSPKNQPRDQPGERDPSQGNPARR